MNFEKKYFRLNYGKKALKKQLSLKNWKKLSNSLKFQKHIDPKKISHQPIGYPDTRTTIGRS